VKIPHRTTARLVAGFSTKMRRESRSNTMISTKMQINFPTSKFTSYEKSLRNECEKTTLHKYI
jgi:hypothetical protein